ncbi:MAG: division/cell wall cluster transcriptional repressor MraZ [Patescibacteria group bacterium]|nr:division/cell wall cluster transcriptional repressor MraZ [Patescibacteria group bacterium]
MKMFLGEYQPNLTEGARLALPKKLRDQIRGDSVILSKGFEKCIFGYDKEDWLKEAEKQVELPISDPKVRTLKRYMFSGAADVELDSQGRLVIPASLKEYASVENGVTVIGAGDHFEIWNDGNWKEHLKSLETSLAG